MNEPTPVLKALRDELLKQNGAAAAVGDEVDRLRRIVASQQRHARRLTYWTVGVWATWFVLITLAVGLPFLNKVTAPPRTAGDPTTQTTAATAPDARQAPAARPPPRPGPVAAVFGVLVFGFMFAAPFVGIILTVMMILARRTAGISEIRASLASIDAQLRLLALSSHPHAPEPPATPK